MIHFEDHPPLSVQEFLAECQRLLTSEESRLMSALLLGEQPMETKNNVAWAWSEFEKNLHNEMAWFRAERAKKNPLEHVQGIRFVEPFLREIVHQADKASDPLTAEKILDRARWDFLENLKLGHYYDIEFLMIYGLKLQIVERYENIRSSKGKENFESFKALDIDEKLTVSL